MGELTSEAADALVEVAGPDSGTPLLGVATRHLGGALASAPAGAGALATVDGEHLLGAVGVVMAPDAEPAVTAALDRTIAAMEPWATGGEFLNFADRPGDASSGFDEDTYRRLREVRAAVAPDGLFVASHPVV